VSAPQKLVMPGPDEVHVWWIDLARMGDVQTVLCSGERARANRFRQARDRQHWSAARAAVRQILAGYTGVDPICLALTEGDWGKPALAGRRSPRFNLAHARERAVLAVAREREVGIDLEAVDPRLEVGPLLGTACTPAEAAHLSALPLADRPGAFLTLWTLKEAYLKGTGTGLTREPRTLAVSLLPGGRATVADPQATADAPPWSLRLLDAGPDWVAALAVEGGEEVVEERAWPESW
jgi:4'-phosphopantetheinyl transferase